MFSLSMLNKKVDRAVRAFEKMDTNTHPAKDAKKHQ
ncbi:hypothetical protein WECI108011_01505 [Weissella cibaria]|jgi:hypothetical protein|uniref:Uncharacterized protein n=1 Tax=Weissella cibaria TaxID=137591 RepID=A0A0D1JCP8_9LACO|nr:hypothetical protein ab3b_02396 [Weissella cibaria]